jgi:hypothetical protein
MAETHEHWIDRLSDYMDGDLDPGDRDALEAHLAECGECREVLAGLREVVSVARGLGAVEPQRDLWPGIAAAIAAPLEASGATVIQLPTARSAPAGIFLSRRQLAAAASVLMLISAAATWAVGPGLGVRGAPDVAGPAAPAPAAQLVSDTPEAPVGVAEELRSLEAALAEARGALDPNTVRIIEKNLAVIDRAIEDSRRALAVDPGNQFLAEHLARSWERKREYLQDAVRVMEWSG